MGCCCAVLVACGAPADAVAPKATSSARQVTLPKPDLPWDEDFAANVTLERATAGDRSVLVPKGIRLPEAAAVTAATEATVVFADDDPTALLASVEESCLDEGYVEYAKYDAVTVWVGHGMAVRLEAREGAQVLAWGPEPMKDAFAAAP